MRTVPTTATPRALPGSRVADCRPPAIPARSTGRAEMIDTKKQVDRFLRALAVD
ncbi:hypothetical protein [Streptomyces griseus]|uniref:hypothetical protein n=1 Tax=Streptomyces griseus TaxID=1911 RepID=UPI00369F6618